MKLVSKLLLYFFASCSGVSFLAMEPIAGAVLVENAGDVASILYDLAAERLEKEEIEQFLTTAGPVLDWAEGNVDRWLEADASDRPASDRRDRKTVSPSRW